MNPLRFLLLRSPRRGAVLACLLAGMLVACGGKSEDPKPTTPPAPAGEPAAGEDGEPAAREATEANDEPAEPALPAPSTYVVAADTSSYGKVHGRILYKGDAPVNPPVEIPDTLKARSPADAEFCGTRNLLVDEVVVLGGGVMNALVELVGIEKGKALNRPELIEAAHCRFRPRVSTVPRGRDLTIRNTNPFPVQLEVEGPNASAFWSGLVDSGSKVVTGPALHPGLYAISDPTHAWVRAFVRVIDHPYFAVTGPDGSFTIEGVPPGNWLVRVWHESLGTAEARSMVDPGAEFELEMALEAKPAAGGEVR